MAAFCCRRMIGRLANKAGISAMLKRAGTKTELEIDQEGGMI